MKIIISGGSGFCGKALHDFFTLKGYEVNVLSRKPIENQIYWDGSSLGDWVKSLENADVLINMCGKSVNCRYTPKNKKSILTSRLKTTKVLHQAIDKCLNPPKVWLNSSTATIYQHTISNEIPNTEKNGKIGTYANFSENVALNWEKEFFKPSKKNIRKVALRTAIVLGKNGGAFPVMHQLAKKGLCTKQGNGMQWISWIHIEDFCRAVNFIINTPNLNAPVNICSINPIMNHAFNQKLQQLVNPLITLPQPTWLLKIGAFFMRTETELILKSRKVYPEKLVENGFKFNYPTIDKCLRSLII